MEEFRLLIARSVATIAPMKSGLKGVGVKGESSASLVATIAPMKRGLKVMES